VHNVIINGLLPGPFDTERQRGPMKIRAEKAGVTLDKWRAQLTAQIPAGRFGTEEEFGAACAYLCSENVGFMVGQNLLLDGGGFFSTV
jgi:3-oxoacyl-[acyl-carrier protein] reductase